MYGTVNAVLLAITLVIGAAEDIKHRKIDIRLPCTVGAWAVLSNMIYDNYSVQEMFADMGIGIGIIMYSAASRGKIGLGDGVLLCIIGVCSGGNTALNVMAAASVCSFIYMLIRSIRRKTALAGAEAAFVPFVAASYIINTAAGIFADMAGIQA